MRNKVAKKLRRLAEAHSAGQNTKTLHAKYKQDYRTREFLNAPVIPSIEQQLKTQSDG